MFLNPIDKFKFSYIYIYIYILKYSYFTLIFIENLEEIYLEEVALPEEFCKKGVLKNFEKFTRKHLCQSLFLNKVAGLRQLLGRL